MNLSTQLKVGDEIWAMENNRAATFQVVRIYIIVEFEKHEVRYDATNDSSEKYHCYYEQGLGISFFKTKQDLLASL